MREQRVYLVTGSSAGVGAATALALAGRGAGVVVNYSREAAPAEEIARACLHAGGDALVVRANVAEDADCRRMASAALEKWGRIDGLVNNAGVTRFVSMRKLDGLEAEDFHHLYGVNLIGPYQMVRACEAALRASRGAVVNVSSIAGSLGMGSSYAYACSKGALNTLTVAMARALAPEIRVNAVLPGFVETRWHEQGMGPAHVKAREAYREKSPLQATIEPQEVAAAIVALLEAKKITGQLQTIDAGRGLGTA